MGLKLGFHGGKCCGIKVIHGFPYPCDDEEDREQLPLLATTQVNYDANGSNVNSEMSFFTDVAPTEGPEDRLNRLIEFCERRRPQGIIEVTLAETKDKDYDQTIEWAPQLLKRGFRLVNKCKNSNSGNTVHVFHKNSGE